MNKIELKSNVFEVKEVLKSTKAKFFKDLEVGDKFTITTHLKRITRTSAGLYAPEMTFECKKSNGNIISDTMSSNQAMNCLDKLLIVEINN
jgi:hypothetical protein